MMEQLSSLQSPAKSAKEEAAGGTTKETAFTGNPVTVTLDFESSDWATSREIGQSGDPLKGSHQVARGEMDQSDGAKGSDKELANDRSQLFDDRASPGGRASNPIVGENVEDQLRPRLVLQGREESEAVALWRGVEHLLSSKLEAVQGMLEDYGIGEGDEDSESEEGLLWKVVEKTKLTADSACVV